jgi:hypothetical protein
VLTYIGLRRARQSNDAEAFGPALLLRLLYRIQPDRVMVNISPEPSVRTVRLMKLSHETDTARERPLVVSAGHPRRRVRDLADLAQVKLGNVNHAMGWQVGDMGEDNPEWVDHYREVYAEAETAMRDLIDTNFAWADPRPTAILRRVRGWRARTTRTLAARPPAQPPGPAAALRRLAQRALGVRQRPERRAALTNTATGSRGPSQRTGRCSLLSHCRKKKSRQELTTAYPG